FGRNRKNRAANHVRNEAERNLGEWLRHLREFRKAFARHTRNAGTRTAANKTRPLIFGELHLNIRIRKEAHVIEQPPSRDGARAILLDSGRARATDAQFQVGGGEPYLILICFDQNVREDRDGGLPLHHALSESQLAYQI